MTNKDLTQGGNFAILPAHIRYNKDLTDSEKILFCEITALSNKNGYCYASNKYLSEIYGVSIDTISRRVNKLKKKGYVDVQLIKEKGGNNIKERRIYPYLDLPTGISNPAGRGIRKVADEGIRKVAGRGIGNSAEDNNLSINNLNTNNLNTNKEKEKENVLFEKWWKSYPKKTASKKDVAKKFEKAIKEVGEEHLFKATVIYLDTVSEIQYVTNPARFFTQKYYSEDAMETNKQILKEKGGNRINSEYYELNKEVLAESAAKREADAESGNLPF